MDAEAPARSPWEPARWRAGASWGSAVQEKEGWGILQEVGCLGEGASSPHKDSAGEVGPPGAAGTSFSSRICC